MFKEQFVSRILFYLLICLTSLTPRLSIGQNPEDSLDIFTMSLHELLSVKVTGGSNVVRDRKGQPVTITSITKEQLELSGARTLLDAIAIYVPGLFVVEDQDDVIIGMRGLAADNNSKVMLLVNGQKLNTEFFWGPPSAILNSSNFDYIDRIEVIRGPGSVTLGQGALLGVINIITKSGKSFKNNETNGSISAFYGMDKFYGGHSEMSINKGDFNSFISLGVQRYDGQQIRNEGWAKDKNNEGYLGGNISDIGTRLKRSSNDYLTTNMSYKGFALNFLYMDHRKDLYNFYRDRNEFRQTLSAIGLSYEKQLTDKLAANINLDFANDDFGLYSVDNYTMGGTKEQRSGAKFLLNINDLIPSNNLAIGTEYRIYYMGKRNSDGNNFINNLITDEVMNDYENYLISANQNKTWGYQSKLEVFSFFMEDFQSIGDHIDIFGAFRFDNHPYWGSNFSPRVGIIGYIANALAIRLSYQEGFRGTVGVHYSGGYREDGLLRADNFNEIEDVPVLDYEEGILVGTYDNLPETKPEKMKSFELSVDYKISKSLNLYTVGFYNHIENVIDVGVIWEDKGVYPVPDIGTDVVGDWNGYWYFKNNIGSIKQGGFELDLTYKQGTFFANLSHSYVKVIAADNQQLGSMYITQGKNFKAYPENVTRLNLATSVFQNLKIGFNYMYYYKWFSPNDQEIKANHMANISMKYTFFQKLSITGSINNVFNQKKLYPMNSNVGGEDLSDGSPSMESTSVWIKIGYQF
ncbi:MAG: TonB-dependent receptor plug domain-containing protein [Reichenbachiella sp.]